MYLDAEDLNLPIEHIEIAAGVQNLCAVSWALNIPPKPERAVGSTFRSSVARRAVSTWASFHPE